VTEPLRRQLIRYLGEVCILFSDRLGASAVSQSVDGQRGGGACPKTVGVSRWWVFVGLRVGVATNVGGSVLSNDMTLKTSAKSGTLGAPDTHIRLSNFAIMEVATEIPRLSSLTRSLSNFVRGL
jgi:hypothetical protein